MESDSSDGGLEKIRDEEKRLIAKDEAELRKSLAELHAKAGTGAVQTRRSSLSNSIKEKARPVYLVSFVVYLLIALVMFTPISLHMGSNIPGVGADSYQNLWGLWWVDYAIFTLHAGIWQTNLFFPPLGTSLIYQTMMPIGAILSLPFQLFGVPFAYDVMFFLGFPLSGITMFILAEYLTKSKYAAFLAGLIFTFSSFHIAESVGHIDWIFVAWIPLALYFLLKVIRDDNSLLNAAGFGISFAFAAFMGDLEQALIIVAVAAVVLVAYLLYKGKRRSILSRRFVLAFAVMIVVALVVGAFGFVPILSALLHPSTISTASQLNTIADNELYSSNLLSFFLPSYFNGLFHAASLDYYYIFAGDPGEKIAYVGYSVLLLAAYGVYKSFKGNMQIALWIAITLIFAWLALGPYIQIGPYTTYVPGIYLLYHHIPVFDILREPSRFDIVAEMGVAVLAAFGVEALFKNLKIDGAKAIVAVAVIGIVILIESGGLYTGGIASLISTTVQVPQVYYQIANLTGNFSILNIPALPLENVAEPELFEGEATYYTSITHKALVGGYIGRENVSQEEYLFNIPLVIQASNLQAGGNFTYDSPVNENLTDQTLLTLYNYNTGLVTLDEGAFNLSDEEALQTYLDGVFGRPVESNNTLVYITSNAINGSVYKSYVAYPLLTEWSPVERLVDGSDIVMWAPLNPGPMIVYAPYANTTGIGEKIAEGISTPIDTVVTFEAEAYPYATSIEVDSLNAQNHATVLAAFNVTNTAGLVTYSFNATFDSGPRTPETLLFITNNATGSDVFLYNITFSKG